jgi:hypothetical protein
MSDPDKASRGIRAPVACGIIVAAVCAAYSNCLAYPFLFDGIPLAEQLRTLSPTDPAGWLVVRPRTFGYLIFDTQYTLHGIWMPGFHAVNIAIHAAAACLLFLLVRGLTTDRLGADRAGLAGLFTALLWGLHPLHTHAVTYVYQRFEALMGLFFLAGLYCLWRAASAAAPRWWLVASYACVLLSIASKEVGIMALPVFLLFDRAFLAASWREVFRRRGWYYGAIVATAAGGVAYILLNRDRYLSGGLLCAQRVSTWQYLRTQPEVIGHYLWLALWPTRLCSDPSWPVQDDPRVLGLAWIVVAALAAATAWLWRRDRQLGFLPLAFVLVLLLTSSVAATIDLAFEHLFRFENLKNGFEDFLVAGDLLNGRTDEVGTNGRGMGKFGRGGAFRAAFDDGNLIGTLLADGGSDLAQAVDHFLLNLMNHLVVAEVDLADINRAQPVAPGVGLWSDFLAHFAAHAVAVFQEVLQRHVA